MSRKIARDTLFKMVFETLFLPVEEARQFEDFEKDNDFDADNISFVKDNFVAIIEHQAEIYDIIKENIENYTFDRIFKIDLAILIMAVGELVYYKKTPVQVVINEGVELAKKYSTPKSYSFINGILAKIIKNIK